MKRRFVLRDLVCFGLCAAAVGCGSGSGSGGGGGGVNGVGSATVMGSVQGNAFTPMDAVAYQPGSITIVDFGGLCAHGLSDARAGATYIYISLDNGFQVGTTQVGTTLDVRDVVWDSQCNSVSHVAARKGLQRARTLASIVLPTVLVPRRRQAPRKPLVP